MILKVNQKKKKNRKRLPNDKKIAFKIRKL